MSKRFIGLFGGALALVLFLSINLLANAGLARYQVDLTEERLFTLSEGSKNIASNLDEPVRLYFFFSKGAAREIPAAVEYADRVRDVLTGLVRHSNGKLILEEIDPEPFSEAEDRATREGITAIPIGPDPLYFGLVGTNALDGREVIPFFGDLSRGLDFQSRERFLEYDLARLIYTLANPDKKRVGVLSSLPVHGSSRPPGFGQPQPEPAWRFLDQIGQFFEVERVETSATELPADLDALVLVHPRDLSEALQYAIDQYVMAGGALVAFVDPHCEQDQSGVDPSNPMSAMGADRGSDLNRLFQAWGFEVVSRKVVGDRANGLTVRDPMSQRGDPIRYVVWMQLREDALEQEDPVSSALSQLLLIAPGEVRALDEATTTLEPLVRSSEESMSIDVGRLQSFPDPSGLLESFVPGMQPLTLAARITGPATSAFADGKPAGLDAPEEGGEEDEAEDTTSDEHLAQAESIRVITVADADLLHDANWLREQQLFGQTIGYSKVADNCDLLVNAIENLIGGEDLISIRARGSYTRPFDRVDELRREAEQKFLAEETRLEEELQVAQRTIDQLQADKDPSDLESMLLFSPEQKQAYDEAMLARTEARKKLRDVRHSLDKDIEALGRNLKLVNIFAVPALVTLAALALGAVRMGRRGT